MKPTAHSESNPAQPGSPTVTPTSRPASFDLTPISNATLRFQFGRCLGLLGIGSHTTIKPCVVDGGIPPLTSWPRRSRRVSMFNIKAAMDALFGLVFLGTQELPA
ncbi:hypothetical protein MGG_15809 [Pyricularia oryzae 70-15]|uniref:Uncharacterized protein n=2 Tax=Pyricularia oryzae TaxID=318829 RepID=G4MXQ0_PYRO7|nr:uncharacterized protein MGG_15809 [Pyricularia oryzae 70-15]KAI6321068.1 hypothetical protein MCOR30_008088 [Pyricularia oryzae]EHA55187.1 hypothetical protein MGG_15809 [Pyricularia oryzae 70-15]KAI6405509.1 hypothetical protein MCOR24_007857 [Pyricularia oryzae]KAI6416084.1 hypothetical protein MCOR20_001232 [Pyricularia oryzae]KAI6502831.1 hypothetical protein MCOR11_001095 [Pyricularia oryzae]